MNDLSKREYTLVYERVDKERKRTKVCIYFVYMC